MGRACDVGASVGPMSSKWMVGNGLDSQMAGRKF